MERTKIELNVRWLLKAQRLMVLKRKLSTRNVDRLCCDFDTYKRTLAVHSEDVVCAPYFTNGYTISKRSDVPADIHVDLIYRDLAQIENDSYKVALFGWLLEHVPNPQRLIDELRQIVKSYQRAWILASSRDVLEHSREHVA